MSRIMFCYQTGGLITGILQQLSFKVVLQSKNTFILSSDFNTLFTKHSPSKILGFNFEKKTVYLNCSV